MQGCLEWAMYRDKAGYGLTTQRVNGRRLTMRAHRWAWEQANGPIPAGLFVRHRCDNPACVRIDHLELGTPKDNTQDSVKRGRWRASHGSPLTGAQVSEIRSRLKNAPRGTGRRLAKEFGVSPTTITGIKKGSVWND